MSTILLAEDTPELRELMAGALRKAGYHVVEAANGMEAMRLFQKNHDINAIVTDLEMPLMNGVQLVKEVRAIDTQIPIVMWSGSMNPGLPITFLSKMDGSKPVIQMLDALLSLEAA